MEPAPKKKIVILGTGFAAFSLIKKLRGSSYELVVVSPRNHFLFTPLLPSTTVGTVEFRSIIEPIRFAKEGLAFYQAKALTIAPDQKKITCRSIFGGEPFSIDFDYLVIAVGAVSNTYGIPGVSEHAFFLKELADARSIRQRIVASFEKAAIPDLPEAERKRLLHFVIVGGGPTGVEFAAELHDFIQEDLQKWFPLAREVRITLLEATDEILSSFDRTLSEYALKSFSRQNIEVRTHSLVTEVRDKEIILKDGAILPCGLVVWSTGIGPTSFAKRLPFPHDRQSRLLVDSFLRLEGSETIFAAGDCAAIAGLQMPAAAQVAQQEGKYLAKTFNRLAEGLDPQPFRYRPMGMLAYIGSREALADLPKMKGKGFSTYIFWRSVYFTKLVSFKNKVLVLFDWLKTRVFGRDISRF